jgi:hypothetical protein
LLDDCRLYSQLLSSRRNKSNVIDNNNDIDNDNDDGDNNNDDDDNINHHRSKGLLLIHVCGDDHWLNYVRQQIQSTEDFDELNNNHHSDDDHSDDHHSVKDDSNNSYKSTILCYTTKN